MSIRTITIDQLRRMEDQEGLVLQGCGGSAREWLDGINRMLTANGCLKNGTVFTNVHVFQKDGSTCLLFPFSDDVKLDVGKLAIWRLRSHDRFGGTWLSDYVENELDGYIHEQPKQSKPDCPLIGADGNIFNLIGLASRTLRENQMAEQAVEMRTRVEQCRSYHAALSIIGEYVNFCTQEECQKHEETHEMSME